jgi:hypothetical protein
MPLAAGPAAGIRQAQGAQRDRIWNYVPFAVVGGLALLIVLATGMTTMTQPRQRARTSRLTR